MLQQFRQTVIHLLSTVTAQDGKPLRFAEIGVSDGKTSATILTHFPTAILYMIDSWAPFPNDHPYVLRGDEFAKKTAEQNYETFRTAQKQTAFAEGRRILIQDDSVSSSRLFVDGWFDAIFLDADHHEDSVYQDLVHWWCKIRPGGLLLCHDVGKPEYGVDIGLQHWLELFPQLTVHTHPGHIGEIRKS